MKLEVFKVVLALTILTAAYPHKCQCLLTPTRFLGHTTSCSGEFHSGTVHWLERFFLLSFFNLLSFSLALPLLLCYGSGRTELNLPTLGHLLFYVLLSRFF